VSGAVNVKKKQNLKKKSRRGFFYHMKSFFNFKWQNAFHLQIGKTFAISKCNFYLV